MARHAIGVVIRIVSRSISAWLTSSRDSGRFAARPLIAEQLQALQRAERRDQAGEIPPRTRSIRVRSDRVE
jgi:hypothetical protein